MYKHLKKWVPIVFFAIVLLVALIFGYIYRDTLIAVINDANARDAFIEQLQGSGIRGIFAFVLLQILQVFISVIPGEPFEIIGGVLYGAFGGFVLCLLGIFIGSASIYYVMKAIGVKAISQERLQKYRFLRDKRRIHMMLFFLYFLPGTPKDMLNYLAPFLPIPAAQFFIISMIARIPSVMASTFAGASIAQGNWHASLVIFIITGIIGMACILNSERIETWVAKLRETVNDKKNK